MHAPVPRGIALALDIGEFAAGVSSSSLEGAV